MKKDIILKDVFRTIVKDISKYFLNININKLSFIDSEELRRVEQRDSDIVFRNENKIIHIEIQNSNDKNMALRMLRYYTDIKHNTDLPIKQYYVGRNTLNMQDSLSDEGLNYQYNLIDIKSIDCELLLKEESPDALVLAILCDFKDKNPTDIVKFIVSKLKEYTKSDLNSFRRYMLMLEELSSNRDLKETVKEAEEMLSKMLEKDYDFSKLPSYEIGVNEGLNKGIKAGIDKGKEIGKKEGKEIGKKEGERLAKIAIAKNSLKNGLEVELISKITGLTTKEIEILKD